MPRPPAPTKQVDFTMPSTVATCELPSSIKMRTTKRLNEFFTKGCRFIRWSFSRSNSCPITTTLFFVRWSTAKRAGSSAGSEAHTRCDIIRITTPAEWAMFTSSATKASRSKTMSTSSSSAATLNETHSAGLVDRAEKWKWSSLYRWLCKPEPNPPLLSPWPLSRLPGWVERVNAPLSEEDLAAVRLSAQRGEPLGDEGWVESIARRLNLESTMRPRGRKRVRFPNQNIKEA